jgi:hypothetical protein
MRPDQIRDLVSECDTTLSAIEDVLDDESMTPSEKVREIESAFYGDDDDSDDESD